MVIVIASRRGDGWLLWFVNHRIPVLECCKSILLPVPRRQAIIPVNSVSTLLRFPSRIVAGNDGDRRGFHPKDVQCHGHHENRHQEQEAREPPSPLRAACFCVCVCVCVVPHGSFRFVGRCCDCYSYAFLVVVADARRGEARRDPSISSAVDSGSASAKCNPKGNALCFFLVFCLWNRSRCCKRSKRV